MANSTTKRIPTNRLPHLQRPTPSRCIRLHLDTHAELSKHKPPGKSFDEMVSYLLRCWLYGEDAGVPSKEAL